MMNNNVTDILKDEILNIIDSDKLDLLKAISKEKDRVGCISDYVEDIMEDTSVSQYNGLLYIFESKIYIEITEDQFNSGILNALRESGISSQDRAYNGNKFTKAGKRGIVNHFLKPKKEIICFKNCILNTRTKEVFNHSKDIHCVYIANYDYNPKSKCPLWYKTLDRILPDDSIRKVLQEYLGLIFLDRKIYKLEKMACLIGTGRNGKSVVYETINGILGTDNVSSIEITSLTESINKEYNIASINGKMLNYCSDMSKKTIQSSSFKSVISGEKQLARFPYGKPFDALDIPLMMANLNELPYTKDNTTGFHERLILIPFDVYISEKEQDKELSTKLREEYSGILNWIFEGTDRIVKNGVNFTQSDIIDAKKIEYEIDSDNVLMFLSDKRYYPFQLHSSHSYDKKTNKELYEEYGFYCGESGYHKCPDRIFGKKISGNKFEKTVSHSIRYTNVYKIPDESYEELLSKGYDIFVSKDIYDKIYNWTIRIKDVEELLLYNNNKKTDDKIELFDKSFNENTGDCPF